MVFGILLSSADAGFGELLGGLIKIDVISLPGRLFVIGFFALFAGAYVRGLLTRVGALRVRKKDKKASAFHMLEAGIALGLINLLFVVFVFMQMGYLFGGAAYIETTGELTLAQYARHGFFELVTVAVLALSVLMWVKQNFKPTALGHEALFRLMAGIQVGLLLIMLTSAAQPQ